ncbi:MAG: hypothetical protein C5B50_09850 [Verrucomicrobia bacterium]|nr:MAG: hypothetical protein C5B50_09850 [Verrucomicrobiota bacterium]
MKWNSIIVGASLITGLGNIALGSENLPRVPFAEWAEVPEQDQLKFRTLYEQSEAYYIWTGNQRQNITYKTSEGESYGIDIRQGYFVLDYGLTERWAADLEFGGTTVGWRSFNPNAEVGETTGIMDLSFGVRYQLVHETNDCWLPTATFRVAGFIPGSYSEDIAFAPGNHSAGIEPSLLLRKHFGWEGFGAWGDALYRWLHTTSNDQYILAVGLFQQIRLWELDVGYRHLQTLSGQDISLPSPPDVAPWPSITYKRDTREISDSFDAGLSYTTRKRHIRLAFHARKTFDGSNTDSKLWLGGSVEVPFDHLFGRE